MRVRGCVRQQQEWGRARRLSRFSVCSLTGLLYRVLCRVSFARVNHRFDFLALLVPNLQRTSVRTLELNFQLPVGAVEFRIRRMVANIVLIADVASDLIKNLRQFALEA